MRHATNMICMSARARINFMAEEIALDVFLLWSHTPDRYIFMYAWNWAEMTVLDVSKLKTQNKTAVHACRAESVPYRATDQKTPMVMMTTKSLVWFSFRQSVSKLIDVNPWQSIYAILLDENIHTRFGSCTVFLLHLSLALFGRVRVMLVAVCFNIFVSSILLYVVCMPKTRRERWSRFHYVLFISVFNDSLCR